MSERNWRDGYALVAVGLMLAAIVVIAALEIGARYSLNDRIGKPDAAAAEQYQEQRGPAEGYWWPEFSTRDTYAQWAMALLAVVGIGVSIVGVIWIRHTLIETRRTANAAVEANETARQIGQAQVRAYLSVAGGKFVVAPRYVFITVEIRNSGQSPSPRCIVTMRLVAPRIYPDRIDAALDRSEPATTEAVSISTSAPETASIPFEMPLGQLAMQYMFENNLLVTAEIELRWVDVFGDWQTAHFRCVEHHKQVATYNGDTPRSRVGDFMVFTMQPGR